MNVEKELIVSVVIPNYNGKHFMDACMQSLRKQTIKNFEIIVVDNGSVDGSIPYIKEKYPEIILIDMKENTGFSGAVNAGIQHAKAPYIFLLNNDTECEPDCIEQLCYTIQKKDNIFSVASKMVQYHNRQLLDSAGDVYTMVGWAFNRGNGKRVSTYEREEKVFTACAGAALYRKSVFEWIGLFDEDFFAYREDIDIGVRGLMNGYENWYCPKAVVYHIGSGTSGSKHNEFKVKLGVRNNLYFNYKTMPLLFLLWNFPFFFLGYVIKGVYFTRKGFGKAYMQGVKEGISYWNQSNKIPFKWKNIGNYMKIQWALYKNTWIIWKDKIRK